MTAFQSPWITGSRRRVSCCGWGPGSRPASATGDS